MEIDAGACMEPEITEGVDLCTSGGLLRREAVGWSRRPLHHCALPGSWGRRKRWDFWCITGDTFAMNVTYADVDYLGIADVWFRDFTSGTEVSKSVPRPFARGMSLPDRVAGGPMAFSGGGLTLSLLEVDGGTRILASFEGFTCDVFVRRPEGHESLGVVIPWLAERFQYTNKDVGRPAEGSITCGGRTFVPKWGCLDFGRGKWPYRTKWNWGAGAGTVDGRTIGIQVGGKWTDGTGMTENALCIDGRLSKISEDLEWTYDTHDWLRPWTIRTPTSDRIDLTFTPIHDKRSRMQLGIASSSVDQCFGTYAGAVIPDNGVKISVEGIFGWAEEATWRW